jgi:general secretion pathway protein G
MHQPSHQIARQGYTLIEIMVVTIILGILAALVIPQFVNASSASKADALVAQLQTVRTEIQRYKAQHKQQWPVLTTWTALTTRTIGSGNKQYGPYLMTAPVNPLNGLSNIVIGTGQAAPADPCGWVYDDTTGRFWATGVSGVRYFNEADPAGEELDSAGG